MDYKKQLYTLISSKKYQEAIDIIINHLEIQETVNVLSKFRKDKTIRNYTFPLIYFIKKKLPEYYNIIALLLTGLLLTFSILFTIILLDIFLLLNVKLPLLLAL